MTLPTESQGKGVARNRAGRGVSLSTSGSVARRESGRMPSLAVHSVFWEFKTPAVDPRSTAAAAGPGNHLDIGSLFGASAITAALVKKELKHSGKVYCLDPYEPRDPSMKPPHTPDALFNATGEALMNNAEKLGVELELIQKKSPPWPEELDKVLFSSAFVGGDPKNGAPWLA